MKRLLVVITVLSVLFVSAIVGVTLWQGKNIESIMMGVLLDSEDIEQQRNENQIDFMEDIKAHMEIPLREMTEEEKEMIENGEASITDIYQKIFEEKSAESQNEQSVETEDSQSVKPEKEQAKDSKSENENSQNTNAENKNSQDKDAIISRYMAKLYSLQNEYTARAEAVISQGASYYSAKRKTCSSADARAATISHFTPIVRGVESECDARVDAIVRSMEAELKAIGADCSIISSVRATYAQEKQLKLSYYSSKYLR